VDNVCENRCLRVVLGGWFGGPKKGSVGGKVSAPVSQFRSSRGGDERISARAGRGGGRKPDERRMVPSGRGNYSVSNEESQRKTSDLITIATRGKRGGARTGRQLEKKGTSGVVRGGTTRKGGASLLIR